MKYFVTIALLILTFNFAAAQVEFPQIANDTTEILYSKTNKNPLYLFGSPFSAHFAEVKYLGSTKEFGAGVTYTYLPEVMGFNVYGAWTHSSSWLGAGMAYRLSKPWSNRDWHAYGNVGIRNISDPYFGSGIRPTLELGVRWAKGEDAGAFCFNSSSVSMLTDFHQVYLTVNFGLIIGILASAGILMAQY